MTTNGPKYPTWFVPEEDIWGTTEVGKVKATDVPEDQIWFVVRESFYDDNDCGVWQTSTKEIMPGLTRVGCLRSECLRKECLKRTHTEGDAFGKPDDYCFWIYSQSMPRAVRVLNSKGLIGTYEAYCQKDHIVQIFIRDAGDPSPWTSRATSYEESRKIITQRLGGTLPPEVPTRQRPEHARKSYAMALMSGVEAKI